MQGRFREEHDPVIDRDVRIFSHDGRDFRYPALLGGRYEPVGVMASGGFGILINALDRRVFDRHVLVKAALVGAHELARPRNAALPDALREARLRMDHERKMLLHGRLRGVGGIPHLIDWFDDVNPTVRGPHIDPDGRTFANDDPSLWRDARYLVLGNIDGVQLDVYCQSDRFRRAWLGETKVLGMYLAGMLQPFHATRDYGGLQIHFVYQDLKPANVMVTRVTGQYHLIDFGSFAVVGPGGPQRTEAHTEGYSAPERAGSLPADSCHPRLDVYSLGVVLSQAIQWGSGSDAAPIETAVDSLPVTAEWKAFLHQCRAATPDARFQSMPQVLATLERLPV
jgi:serine/threonine protein kinase